MSDLVNEMLGKFIALSQEEKQIAADTDAAYKEYTDYCADSEKDLNKKIDEIHEKMDKLNYFVDYAREHANASELEEATAPFDTPQGTLESIRQTIKLDSHNDPNAESLYTKATGKKLYYEQEIARTRQLIEGSKVQAKRQYDSEAAKLNQRKDEHFDKVRAYVQSGDFSDYLKLLVYDKSAFNSPGTVTLNDEDHVSLGQRRVKLSVPMEIEQDVALSSNGEYNASARTIGAPFQISSKKGSTLFLEHDDRNDQYLLGGIQRLLLNFIKYFGENLTSVIFCEPDRFSVDSLGNISALGKGINPFITVPKSMDEISDKVTKLAAKAAAAPTPDKVSRILVLQNFPEKYTPDIMNKVVEMCKTAEQSGLLIILTHKVPMDITPIEAEVRGLSEVIRSRNGGFWIEKAHESLFWYSAPSDISEEVRKVYVDKRRQDALKAATEDTQPEEQPAAYTAPAPVEEPKPEEQPAAYTAPAPVEEPKPEEQPAAYTAPAPAEEPKPEEQPAAYTAPAPAEEPKPEEQPAAYTAPAPVEEPKPEEQPAAYTAPAPVEEPKPEEQPAAYTAPAPAEEPKPEEQPAAYTAPAPVEEPKPARPSTAPNYEDENLNSLSVSENGEPVPAHILFSIPRPKPEEKEVTLTVVSEICDQLPPPVIDAPEPAPELAPDFRPEQTIDPEYTYRITDPKPQVEPEPKEETAADDRADYAVTPDMTYKITDYPERVASMSMNAPSHEPEEVVEKSNPIKNVLDNVIDAGKRKIESLVDSRKTTDYPIRSLLDDEPVNKSEEDMQADAEAEEKPAIDYRTDYVVTPDMTYRITDPKPQAEPEPEEEPAADDRADYAVTPDMTYKITDYPERVASMSMNAPSHEPEVVVEKSSPIKNVLDAGKNVIDAGKRKIESLVDSRKTTDYPIRSLLDDEPVNKSEEDMQADAETEEKPAIDYRTDYVVTPDMTYRITDPKPQVEPEPKEEPVVDYRSDYVVTPDMTYKITDYPERVASMSMNTPSREPEATVEKNRPIKNVLDAGKRKIGSLVEGRKSTIYPIRSLLDDEPVKRSVADFSLDAEPEVPDKSDETAATLELKPDVEAVPVENIPEPVIENVYGKGVRKLPLIPIGATAAGRPVYLNVDGNITYICGARGDERKTLTDRVISQITADTHPDDVELWMFDCGDGEFMKYAEDPAAHIKYLVSDTGAETSVDFADLIAAELERRVEAFAENGWSGVGDIPADVFMPLLVVAVNAFPRFSENIVGTTKYFGRNYNNKLTKLFKSCPSYGIHFLLIGDEFSEDGERPICLEGCTIHSAAVVSGRDNAAHKLFSGIKLYDNEIESLRKISAGCAFTADENSTNGLTLVRISGENAKNEHSYDLVSEYSEELEKYLDKHPFIGDRKTASNFDDRREYREAQISKRTADECLLFLGEPCRFMGEYPVRLYDDFGENLFAIAPAREKSSAALMVKAALRSLEEQGLKAEVLACRSNPVYVELHRNRDLENVTVYEGLKVEERVKDIADQLDKGERPDVFEIVLGGDLLMASMQANDQLSVLKRALVKGPSLGTHFMFVSGSASQAATEFLSLFRHKLVFACPYSEAEKILRDPNCDLPENSFRLSNDYDELSILPYSM